MTAATAPEPVGAMLRRWRELRRRSQLDVSLAAGVSTRHLSCVETGRAVPSPAMIERLCEELDVPLRRRNALHLAAGFAPAHRERPFEELGSARDAVHAVLSGLEPNPALAVNAHWHILAANTAVTRFFDGIPDELLTPPVNVLRATLHPDGLAPRIRNLAQWRAHTLRRIRRRLDRTADPALTDLLTELTSYGPAPDAEDTAPNALTIPLRLAHAGGELAFLYTTTVFGAARDVTLDEIAIETFLPADPDTARILRTGGSTQAGSSPPPPPRR